MAAVNDRKLIKLESFIILVAQCQMKSLVLWIGLGKKSRAILFFVKVSNAKMENVRHSALKTIKVRYCDFVIRAQRMMGMLFHFRLPQHFIESAELDFETLQQGFINQYCFLIPLSKE